MDESLERLKRAIEHLEKAIEELDKAETLCRLLKYPFWTQILNYKVDLRDMRDVLLEEGGQIMP